VEDKKIEKSWGSLSAGRYVEGLCWGRSIDGNNESEVLFLNISQIIWNLLY
jgi:hypothetical protein